MKTTLRKLACLTLALLLLLATSGAATASFNPATITLSASQWEANFQNLLEYAVENGLPLTDNTAFSVAELTAPDGRVGSEHSLVLADFMRLAYYDFGDDVFDSAMLTIRLDHGGQPIEMAQMAIFFTILAGDTNTTWEEFNELMEEMCPTFSEVFAGEESIDGVLTVALRGVGYAMNVTDEGRFLRLYTNFTLTPNDAQPDNGQGTGGARTLASMKQAVIAAGYEVNDQMDYYTDPSIPKPIAGFTVIHDGLKYGVKVMEFASPDNADAYARFVSNVSDGIYVLNVIAVEYSIVQGDIFTEEMEQKLLGILSAS